MTNLLKVAISGGRTGLVNMENVTSVIYERDDASPQNSKLHLQFDYRNTVVLLGQEAQRLWDLLTEGKEWKIY